VVIGSIEEMKSASAENRSGGGGGGRRSRRLYRGAHQRLKPAGTVRLVAAALLRATACLVCRHTLFCTPPIGVCIVDACRFAALRTDDGLGSVVKVAPAHMRFEPYVPCTQRLLAFAVTLLCGVVRTAADAMRTAFCFNHLLLRFAAGSCEELCHTCLYNRYYLPFHRRCTRFAPTVVPHIHTFTHPAMVYFVVTVW